MENSTVLNALHSFKAAIRKISRRKLQLVTQYDVDPGIRRLVDEMDWFILPVLNPDGYEYTRSSTDPQVRLWRKNLSPPNCRILQNGTFDVITQCQFHQKREKTKLSYYQKFSGIYKIIMIQ